MSTFEPAIHSVHFYETDEALIHRLSAIVCSGFLNGNSVLLVATHDHRTQLVNALDILGVDGRKYEKEHLLTMCDAEELLSKFMVKDLPDPQLSFYCVGKRLMDAREAARGKTQGLIVFGEMVSVLWQQGNIGGALALERLWNDVITERVFHLHCAYPSSLFSEDEPGILNVCESHSHIIGRLTPAVAS